MIEESMQELMDEFDDEHNTGHMEGRQGVEGLCKLVRALGYKDTQYFGAFAHDGCYGDLIEFFQDNSGAIQAVREWIAKQNIPEWKESLESHLTEKEDDESDE